MSNLFYIAPDAIPPGTKYGWLDLKAREWDAVEFLPNGWERVLFERHPDLVCKHSDGFIEIDGLTLCEQSTASEARKQGLDWNAASNMAAEFEKSFADHTRVLGLIPIPDAAGLQPPPGAEVISTRERPGD